MSTGSGSGRGPIPSRRLPSARARARLTIAALSRASQALAFARGAHGGPAGLVFPRSFLSPPAAASLEAAGAGALAARAAAACAAASGRPPFLGAAPSLLLRAMTTKAWKTREKAAVIKQFAGNKIKSSSSFKFRCAHGMLEGASPFSKGGPPSVLLSDISLPVFHHQVPSRR